VIETKVGSFEGGGWLDWEHESGLLSHDDGVRDADETKCDGHNRRWRLSLLKN